LQSGKFSLSNPFHPTLFQAPLQPFKSPFDICAMLIKLGGDLIWEQAYGNVLSCLILSVLLPTYILERY